jgi:hypothetical protein
MSKHDSTTDQTDAQAPDETPWRRLASTEPIHVRDPLAEVLGMVPDGEPLVFRFEDVAKAAGHACPAVAGAYRSTQIALDRLYPEEYPVRSNVAVTVGGDPDEPGIGPMANVIRQITGAADETGFVGFGGYGGREDLLSFGTVDGPGRAFRFERTDADDAVVVSFDPASTGVDPEDGGPGPMQKLSAVVSGETSTTEREAFYEQWHGRVQRILTAPREGGPFTVDDVE